MRPFLAFLALASCTTPSNTQVSGGNVGGTGACATCRRTSGGNGTGGGSTGTATSGGASGGASTGGPTDAGCETVAQTPPTPLDCTGISTYFTGDAGSCPGDWFGTNIIDYGTCNPVCNLLVQLIGPDGLPIAGESQESDPATGAVHLCLDAGLVYTPSVSGNDYATYYGGEVSGQLGLDLRALGVFKDTEVTILQTIIPGGVDVTRATAIFGFLIADSDCPSRTGWTVSLAFPDGGSYPDGSYTAYYVDDLGVPSPTQASTSSVGEAFVVNIDTKLGPFVIPVYRNVGDAGCNIENEAIGYTGRLYVSPGNYSEQLIYLTQ